MTGFTPKEKLTAYQRWEVAAFDEAEEAARLAKLAPPPEPELAPVEITEASETFDDQPEEPPLILPTAADIERIHNEAHEQGFTAGFEEGMTEARAILQQVDALMSNLKEALAELDQSVAEQLLNTSIEVANQMVRQSLRVKPELLLPVVREAVDALHPTSGHPALFAHPGDAALIRTHLGDQLAHNNWRIIDDATLTPGGCRVELGASEVDATFETRWRRIIESIGISQEWLDERLDERS